MFGPLSESSGRPSDGNDLRYRAYVLGVVFGLS
jgi:hypothetical protein